jgi:hypothetical protein
MTASRPSTPEAQIEPITAQKHKDTPYRNAIIAVQQFCIHFDQPCTYEMLREVFHIPEWTAKRIVKSGQSRRFHNIPDSGPDIRGRPRFLTRDDLAAIEDLIDQGYSNRRLTWRGLGQLAGL